MSSGIDSSKAPYFNWDSDVSENQVRRALTQGTEAEQAFWVARIMREARYQDVWQYLDLQRDILPRWEKVRVILGRKRRFWEFLIQRWRANGLID